MKHNLRNAFALFIFVTVALFIASCSPQDVETAEVEQPARIEQIEGAEFNRVILTDRAAERLDVQTAVATEETIEGEPRIVLPYSSLIYGLNGETWVYSSPEALTFTRVPVTVDYIDEGMVYLTEGPEAGTAVATVAVAELYGIDTGVGK